MADHLFDLLTTTPIDTFTALQSPANVVRWLMLAGKSDTQRTCQLTVQNPVFQKEMNSINLLGKFVEQEQLIQTYEALISDWLKS
ncbi:hypothetical protein [Levilactobacillus wangkuiensis]|uniref:hypothetical protein n=1 Tax=Levilactobacillus wangkuiensis TaxID=2799566 RepID=UPI0019412AD3|nr:hypothetical protein [Levilactobacillus wangkuiensis]